MSDVTLFAALWLLVILSGTTAALGIALLLIEYQKRMK